MLFYTVLALIMMVQFLVHFIAATLDLRRDKSNNDAGTWSQVFVPTNDVTKPGRHGCKLWLTLPTTIVIQQFTASLNYLHLTDTEKIRLHWQHFYGIPGGSEYMIMLCSTVSRDIAFVTPTVCFNSQFVWNDKTIIMKNNIYPRGEKYSREVIFAFSRIAKIAKFCAS